MTLEAILSLPLDQIQALFPQGLTEIPSKKKEARYGPCEDGEPAKTLKELLKEKRDRTAPKRLLGKTHGYTENPAFALRTVPDAGEAVDELTQTQYSEEGWQGFLGGLEEAGSKNGKLYARRRVERKAA